MRPVYEQMGLSSNVVYIRPLAPDQLPDDVVTTFEDDRPIYGVFHEDGTQIALIDDVNAAHELAKEHKFSLHMLH